MCRDEFIVKKGFYECCGFHFFLRKCPVAVELNIENIKNLNIEVVEQTRNVSMHIERSWQKVAIYVMCSRDTKIKRTLLESCLGLLTKEYEKNPSYRRTIKNAG